MKRLKAKKISFNIIGIDNKEAQEIIIKIARKYKNKFYFGHWQDVEVVK